MIEELPLKNEEGQFHEKKEDDQAQQSRAQNPSDAPSSHTVRSSGGVSGISPSSRDRAVVSWRK
jgi:hypothetical protein